MLKISQLSTVCCVFCCAHLVLKRDFASNFMILEKCGIPFWEVFEKNGVDANHGKMISCALTLPIIAAIITERFLVWVFFGICNCTCIPSAWSEGLETMLSVLWKYVRIYARVVSTFGKPYVWLWIEWVIKCVTVLCFYLFVRCIALWTET